jgi:hypothetical protein
MVTSRDRWREAGVKEAGAVTVPKKTHARVDLLVTRATLLVASPTLPVISTDLCQVTRSFTTLGDTNLYDLGTR